MDTIAPAVIQIQALAKPKCTCRLKILFIKMLTFHVRLKFTVKLVILSLVAQKLRGRIELFSINKKSPVSVELTGLLQNTH
jgi:hypothetical protein